MATDSTDTPTMHLAAAETEIDQARSAVDPGSALAEDLAALQANIEALIDRIGDTSTDEPDGDGDSDDAHRIPTPGGLRAL